MCHKLPILVVYDVIYFVYFFVGADTYSISFMGEKYLASFSSFMILYKLLNNLFLGQERG
jgi:hypothetical protein